jgi:hypothetical protein
MPDLPPSSNYPALAHFNWGALTPSPTVEAFVRVRLEHLGQTYPGLGPARVCFSATRPEPPVGRARKTEGAGVTGANGLAPAFVAGGLTDIATPWASAAPEAAEVDVVIEVELATPEAGRRWIEHAGKGESALRAADSAFHTLAHRLRRNVQAPGS